MPPITFENLGKIAALGIKTSFKAVFAVGWRPVGLMMMETSEFILDRHEKGKIIKVCSVALWSIGMRKKPIIGLRPLQSSLLITHWGLRKSAT